MQLNEIFKIIEKNLTNINEELGFKKSADEETAITFTSDKGAYRLSHNSENSILSFECAYETEEDTPEFKTISRNLLELETADERDMRSISNDVAEEVQRLFQKKKPVDLDKVKMPKAVSRTKAKNGMVSYDTDSLANRFGTLFPELKEEIKRNVVQYGEFLPETFFQEHGTPKVLEVLQNGTEAEQKKMFKMFCEVYEDGTNEVQDIIGVTILGAMKNDAQMMAVADKYMTEYMAGPVHEINKLTEKKNRFTKQLANPPAYKPKKKQRFSLANALGNMQDINGNQS